MLWVLPPPQVAQILYGEMASRDYRTSPILRLSKEPMSVRQSQQTPLMTDSFDLSRIDDLIGSQRQFNDKCSALAKLALDGDCAAVDVEDLSRDVEAKTKTAKAMDRPCTLEAVENSRLVGFGYPRSVVSNGNSCSGAGSGSGHIDGLSPAVFYGVRQ